MHELKGLGAYGKTIRLFGLSIDGTGLNGTPRREPAIMIALTSLAFALAALLYGALAVWRIGVERWRASSGLLAFALLAMAGWGLANLTGGVRLQIVMECLRNISWVVYLWFAIRSDGARYPQRWVSGLPFLLLVLVVVRAGEAMLGGSALGDALPLLVALGSALAFCIGALVLVHSLYFATHRRASGFRLILIALALLWTYDLNLYAAVLMRFELPPALIDGRAFVALALAPVIAIAVRRKERWTIALSRTVAFQSLSLIAIGVYFVLVSMIARTKPWLRDAAGAMGETMLLVAISAVAILLLASSRTRARIKVFVTKHLFEHRYDYRAEWLRFNATINSGRLAGLGPEQRAVKAVADLMEATGGLLYVRSGHGRLVRAASFEWPDRAYSDEEVTLSGDLLHLVESESHIMISPYYGGESGTADFPEGLSTNGSVWLAVPLVRTEGLIGLVALGRPQVPRDLDWEDFDLLKVLSQQIATYVADSLRQAELEEARQFEEFNRRFAFIVHDIKNVVSQLSLVAENATEHGANPRFQADMSSTLRNSVGKMTTLLSRLSLEPSANETTLEQVDASALIEQIARARHGQHPVSVTQNEAVTIYADWAKLHTAIEHLVQNAIEASGNADPVLLSAHVRDNHGIVSVLDTGGGMSPQFVRNQLFKPFVSTKAAGFGIGAGEARALIRQMGGELEVQSIEGVGTSFLVTFPLFHTSGRGPKDDG